MFKKICIIFSGFALVSIFNLLGPDSANAMEVSSQNIVLSSELVAQPVDTKDIKEEAELTENGIPSIFTTFTVSRSSLAVNQYVASSSTRQLKKGSTATVSSLAWAPANQKIQIGFIHAVTKKQYWTPLYSGGVVSSGQKVKLNGPTGQYYVAIGTPNTNTTSINVIGHFKF